MGQLLLDRGADPNQACSHTGATPLYMASENDHIKIATLLLDRSADPNQASSTGATPLYMASENDHVEIATLLLDRGADPNKALTDGVQDGVTPLSMASQKDHVEIATLLLDRGADLNKARMDGSHPLYMAIQSNSPETAMVLLARGADPNQTNSKGVTPLHLAACKGRLQLAQLLAAFGANLAATFNGHTALVLADGSGLSAIVDFLQAVATWTPLKIAVACRLHAAAKSALKLGLIDPAFTTAAELTNTASRPAGAMWPGSPAVCTITTTLATAAAMPVWSPGRHFLYHGGVRISVHTMLLISERLRRRHGAQSGGTRRSIRQLQHGPTSAGRGSELPVLPSELWLVICSFVLRSHWGVPPR